MPYSTQPGAAPQSAPFVGTEALNLPNGEPFAFWDDCTQYTRTFHVACNHPDASDAGDGSESTPFKTIQRAAKLLAPGQRVVIHAGHYREHVRPARGGESGDRMICYEAAPGETVTISGSEVYTGPFTPTTRWETRWDTKKAPVWHVNLPKKWFMGQLPFGVINMPQRAIEEGPKNGIYSFPSHSLLPLLLRRGLVFQDGRRLKQMGTLFDLSTRDGSYWCEKDGLTVHIRPFADVDPASSRWEFTAREQAFAPDVYGLNYVRVKGLSIEHCADGFPWPQRAALSTAHGTHWIVEGCTIRQVNALAMDLGRQHPDMTDIARHGFHVIRKNVIRDCGIGGISGTAQPMAGLLIEDNRISN